MGTHFKGKPSEVRALDAYIKLRRATNTLQSELERALAEDRLTETQFGVLEVLMHLGPLCQRELGRKLLVSGGNVTMVVDNLEKRDLVRRERGVEDRRFITVHLTAAGRRAIEKVFPGHVRRIVGRFSALDAAEQAELGRLCRKLGLSRAE